MPLALDTMWCWGNLSDAKSTECDPRRREVNLRSMSSTKPTPNPGSGFELILVFMLRAMAAKALCAWGDDGEKQD